MNIDFHYYATFFAAISAGFTKGEAEKIAWAAEMVDELDYELVKDNKKKIREEDYVITVQNGTYDLLSDTEWSDDFNTRDQNGMRGVWSMFHFLPGHFDGGYQEVVYKGQLPQDFVDITKFDTTYIDACLKLRCGKNSKTVNVLLNRIKSVFKENYKEGEENHDALYALGMAMHILADTWAHDDFSGVPCYMVNTVRYVAQEPDQGIEKNVDDYFNAPMTEMKFPSVNSAGYLGHGQINHAPDYDFFSYRYYPRYLCPGDNLAAHAESKIRFISNPSRFTEAILGLYNAMNFVSGKSSAYDPGDTSK